MFFFNELILSWDHKILLHKSSTQSEISYYLTSDSVVGMQYVLNKCENKTQASKLIYALQETS